MYIPTAGISFNIQWQPTEARTDLRGEDRPEG